MMCGKRIMTPQFNIKGRMSWSVCANLTLYQLHYEYLPEDVVQIVYAPLEASAIVFRKVRLYSHSCSTDGTDRHNTVSTTI